MAATNTPKCNYDQCAFADRPLLIADDGEVFANCFQPDGDTNDENCPYYQQKCPVCDGGGVMSEEEGELLSIIVIRGSGNTCSVDFSTYPNIDDNAEPYTDTAVLSVTSTCLHACRELMKELEGCDE